MSADYLEWSKLTLSELEDRFRNPTSDVIGYEEYYFSELSFAIRLKADGLEFLLDVSQKIEGPRLAGILDALSTVRDPRVAPLALACIHEEQEPCVRASALDCLRFQEVRLPEGSPQLETGAEGPPLLVAAVLRYITWRDGRAAVPVLVSALNHPSALVRCESIDQLDEEGFVEAVPAIERLVNDPDEEVRTVARDAVGRLKRRWP